MSFLYFPIKESWQGFFRQLCLPTAIGWLGWQGRGIKSFPEICKEAIGILDIFSKA